MILFPAFEKGSNINSLSGTPYFILEATKSLGLNVEPVDIPDPKKMYAESTVWRLGRLLQGKSIRGFTMSDPCLISTWHDKTKFPDGCRILSIFSVISPYIIARAARGEIELNYYIDITYREFCQMYTEGRATDKELAARSFEFEKRGYKAAKNIICFSSSSAKFINKTYNVDPRKIFTVRPGANIIEAEVNKIRPNNNNSTLVVGFVGMDWNRKGLPAIALAIASLRQEGLDIQLMIAGDAPDNIAKMNGVKFVGRIDKAKDMRGYIKFLNQCDIGMLISEAEGLPMSLLEFLRMGKPVIGSDVNGIPDIVTPDVGVLLPKGPTQDQIKTALRAFATKDDYYQRLSKGAVARKDDYSWSSTARELGLILAP